MECTEKSYYRAMATVSVRNIKMNYGKVQALKGVSFEANEGELFGIIGPDGAGKTSLFRILTTLLIPTDGSASIRGYDIIKDYTEIRRSVGYMPGRFSLYEDLTVEENLSFFASVFNTSIQENYHLVEDIYKQIEPFKNRRAGKLSGGMKQKLALCCAMIHKPEVLFLDEPTTGVDPVSRKEFWEMLKRLKNQGITIIVSTPYMDEAGLCDRIALINDGSFLKIDTPNNIIEQYDGILCSAVADKSRRISDMAAINKLEGVRSCYAFGEQIHIVLDSEAAIPSLRQVLNTDEIKRILPTIEDCFMELNR